LFSFYFVKCVFLAFKKCLSINMLAVKKRVKKDDKFSSTEVGAPIESMRAEFKPFLELIPGIHEKLNSTFEQVGKNTEDIHLIKFTLNKHSELLNRILEELKSKIDRKDFEFLEKKVASLAR